MKICFCLLLGTLTFFTDAFAQSPGEFVEPWKDANRALVLDTFWDNTLDCKELAKEPRVAGIIHKATEGRTIKDSRYQERKKECKENYKWGSFHLGLSGNPIAQADFYLKTAKPEEDEVMALDLEDTHEKNPKIMSLSEAVIFINRIKEKTGRYPILYIPERVRRSILKNYGKNSVFSKTKLWYARYCLDLTDFFPTKLWDSYTLLQFASEINCPTTIGSERNCPFPKEKRCPLSAPIPGTDYDMDVNVFNGTVEELKSQWGKF